MFLYETIFISNKASQSQDRIELCSQISSQQFETIDTAMHFKSLEVESVGHTVQELHPCLVRWETSPVNLCME
eukprot:6457662-Amphidinium_carterae.1